MDGYLGDEQGYQPVDKPARVRWWKILLAAVAYMIPLFWLWARAGFPDSMGVHIAAHGKVGLLEDWYYSYLLLERHTPLDIVTFLYMWGIVSGYVAWLVWAWQKDKRAKQAAAVNRNTPSIFDAEEADERRRRTLIALATSLAVGALLIAILYFKGA
jgi:hypothetical protein